MGPLGDVTSFNRRVILRLHPDKPLKAKIIAARKEENNEGAEAVAMLLLVEAKDQRRNHVWVPHRALDLANQSGVNLKTFSGLIPAVETGTNGPQPPEITQKFLQWKRAYGQKQ